MLQISSFLPCTSPSLEELIRFVISLRCDKNIRNAVLRKEVEIWVLNAEIVKVIENVNIFIIKASH
jgi:hypothetical protein